MHLILGCVGVHLLTFFLDHARRWQDVTGVVTLQSVQVRLWQYTNNAFLCVAGVTSTLQVPLDELLDDLELLGLDDDEAAAAAAAGHHEGGSDMLED
jgi:hypothetical protein